MKYSSAFILLPYLETAKMDQAKRDATKKFIAAFRIARNHFPKLKPLEPVRTRAEVDVLAARELRTELTADL